MTHPSTIGPYRILSLLGQGGMGAVYRAVDASGVEVAVKRLLFAQSKMLRSIRREIHSLGRVSHPGVVRILDDGVHEGLPWYAMELISGRDLRQWWAQSSGNADLAALSGISSAIQTQIHIPIGSEQTLPPESALPLATDYTPLLWVLRSLCEALAFLHSEGLVHRDLKPENVLVTEEGRVILVDFGLSTHEGYGGREQLHFEHGISGTAYYMSPEQIQQEQLDARTDLYALGVILYELLLGRRPFAGETHLSVLQAHLRTSPDLSLLQFLPERLSSLIKNLLTKKREERLPGYAEDVWRVIGSALNAPDEPLSPRPKSYLYRAPLAGRDASWAQMKGSLAALQKGEGGLLLLSGESGIGKTRLILEVAKEAATRSIPVMTGSCDALSRRPLSVFLPILQHIADECGEDESKAATLLGDRGKLLSLYIPALSALPAVARLPAPAVLPPEAARRRLFAALGETLFLLAAERPLLLLLDDLQWADELSLGFLQFFLQSGLLSKYIFIIASYRAEERSPELAALVEDAPFAQSISLGRLQEEDVGVMLKQMLLMPSPPTGFARFLTKQSEGNPLFIAEYLRVAVDEGILFRDALGAWQLISVDKRFTHEEDYQALPLPSGLRELLSRQLMLLGSRARFVLQVCAVLGREVSPMALFQVLDLPEETIEELVQELIQKRLLEESDAMLRFVHDKLREVAYSLLTDTERTRLHRIAAETLTLLLSTEQEAELGRHWEMAGEAEKARPLYSSAIKKSAALYHHKEAENLFQRYLAVSPLDLVSLDVRLAFTDDVLWLQGRAQDTLQSATQALDEAKRLQSPAREARALRLLAMATQHFGALDEAANLLQQAIERPLIEPEIELQCLGQLANLHRIQGRPEAARSLFDKALQIARRIEAQELEGSLLGRYAVLMQEHGSLDESISLYKAALAIFHKTNNKRQEGIQLANLATVYIEQGERTLASQLFQQAQAIAKEIGDQRMEGLLLGNLAALLMELGQLEESEQAFVRALQVSRAIFDKRIEGAHLGNLAELYVEQGKIKEAHEGCVEALRISREIGDKSLEGGWLSLLAAISLWSGTQEEVEQLCIQAEALHAQQFNRLELAKLCCIRGHLSLWRAQSASEYLQQASELLVPLKVSSDSWIMKKITTLQHAQDAHLQRESLLRGHRIEDIPQSTQLFLLEQDH